MPRFPRDANFRSGEWRGEVRPASGHALGIMGAALVGAYPLGHVWLPLVSIPTGAALSMLGVILVALAVLGLIDAPRVSAAEAMAGNKPEPPRRPAAGD